MINLPACVSALGAPAARVRLQTQNLHQAWSSIHRFAESDQIVALKRAAPVDHHFRFQMNVL